ncbi:MAG: hypothetical protein V3R83_01495, partial [Gammaproteobacteria bacterium]
HAPGHAEAIDFLSMMGLRLSMPWLSIHLGRLVTLLSRWVPVGLLSGRNIRRRSACTKTVQIAA